MTGDKGAVMAGAAFVRLSMNNAELVSGIKEAQNFMEKFCKAVNAWGTEVALTTAVLQAPFMKVLDIFADFDLKMRQVQAISNATGASFTRLTEQARALGRATSFTTSQVANTMVILSRMGLQADEIGNSIRPIMNLAKATGDELNIAAQVAGNAMRIFGMKSSEVAKISDIVTVTVNGSAQSLNDFAEALAKAGPKANASKNTLKELSASIGVLANMGIKGAIAGTSIARAMTQLADPKVQGILKSYGIDATYSSGKMRPFLDVIIDIAKSLKGLPDDKGIALMQDIFDVRGSTAALALKTDPKAIEAFIEKLNNCQGIAEKTAKKIDSGLNGALTRMKSAINDVGISMGKSISFAFVDIIEFAANSINKLNDKLGKFIDLFAPLMQGTAILLSLGLGAKSLMMIGRALSAVFMPFVALEKKLTGAEAKAQAAADAARKRTLERTAMDAQATAQEMRNSAKRAEAFAAEQRAKANAAKADYDKATSDVVGTRTTIATAKAAIATDSVATGTKTAAVDDKIGKLQAQRTLLAGNGNVLKAELATQKTIVAELEKKNAIYTKELSMAQAAEAKVAQEAAAVKALNAERAKTGALVTSTYNTYQQRQAAVAKGEANVVSLRNAQVNLAAALRANEEQIAQKKDLVAKFENEHLRTSHGMLAIAKNRLATLNSQHTALLNQRDENAKNLELQQASLKTLIQQRTEAEKAYTKAQAQNAALGTKTVPVSNAKAGRNSGAIASEKALTEATMATAQASVNATNLKIEQNVRSINAVDAEILKQNELKIEIESSSAIFVKNQNAIAANAEVVNVKLSEQQKQLSMVARQTDMAARAAERQAAALANKAAAAEKSATASVAAAANTGSSGGVTAEAKQNLLNAISSERLAKTEMVAKREAAISAETQLQIAQNEKARFDAYSVQEASRLSQIQQVARWEIEASEGRVATAQSEISTNQQVSASISARYEKAMAYSKTYVSDVTMEMSVTDGLIAKQQQLIASETGGSQARLQNLQAHRAAQQANIQSYQNEISVMEQNKAAEMQASETAIQNANAAIAKEEQYQAALKNTIQIQQQKMAALAIGRSNTGTAVDTAAATAVNARREAANAEELYFQKLKMRIAAEKAGMTQSQRWAKAWATRTKSFKQGCVFAGQYANSIMKTSIADMVAAKKSVGASTLRTMGYYMEAAGAKVAAAATIAFKAALDFVCDHPIMVALMAIPLLIGAIKRQFDKAREAAKNYADAASDAANKSKADFENKSGEYADDREKMDYLVKLSKQTQLSYEQQKAAMDVIDSLKSKYGNLGIVYDEITGKITGAAEAQKRLNEEQKKGLGKLVGKTIEDKGKEVTAITRGWGKMYGNDDISKELGFKKKKVQTGTHKAYIYGQEFEIPETKTVFANDELENLDKKTDEQIQGTIAKFLAGRNKAIAEHGDQSDYVQGIARMVAVLNEYLDARKKERDIKNVKLPGKGDGDIPLPPPEEAPKQSDYDSSLKEAEQIEKEIHKADKTSFQNELDALDEKKKKYNELIDLQIKYLDNQEEMKKKEYEEAVKKGNQKLADLAQKEIEKTRAERKQREKQRKETDTTFVSLAYKKTIAFEAREKHAKNDMAKPTGPYVDAFGKKHENGILFEEAEKEDAKRKQEREYNDFLKEGNFDDAAAMLETMASTNSTAITQARQAVNEQLENMRSNGYYNDAMVTEKKTAEKEKYDALMKILQEEMSKRQDIRSKAEGLQDQMKNGGPNLQSIGNFSAKALDRALIAKDKTSEKIEANTQSAAVLLENIMRTTSSILGKVGTGLISFTD